MHTGWECMYVCVLGLGRLFLAATTLSQAAERWPFLYLPGPLSQTYLPSCLSIPATGQPVRLNPLFKQVNTSTNM